MVLNQDSSTMTMMPVARLLRNKTNDRRLRGMVSNHDTFPSPGLNPLEGLTM
jgi:hypothetical protein